MVKRVLSIAMAILFCFSIVLTGCGNGAESIQPENSSERAGSSASPGTTASVISSDNKGSETEVSDELSNTVSSELSGSQAASSGGDSSTTQTSAETSNASSSETTDKQAPVNGQASPSSSGSQSSSAGSEASLEPGTGQSNENVKSDYFLAGSFNGYVANDMNFQMKLVPGSQTWYTYTVLLTEDNRDALYDGHWYKVTTGDWNAPSYGNDNYCIKNPPVKHLDDGTAIGLGSIWVDENIELTVIFDSTNKIVYDNANGKSLPTP